MSKLPQPFVDKMAESLKAIAHPYRIRILEFLDLNGPAPVHRIQQTLGGVQGAISQHLNKMRRVGLIAATRKGKEVWYSLDAHEPLTLLNCMRERCQKAKNPKEEQA